MVELAIDIVAAFIVLAFLTFVLECVVLVLGLLWCAVRGVRRTSTGKC